MSLFRKRRKSGQIERINENTVPGRELFCLCESKEDAASIAKQYEIELVEWKDGVGVFHTEKDLRMLIKEGIEKGYARLSINSFKQIAD